MLVHDVISRPGFHEEPAAEELPLNAPDLWPVSVWDGLGILAGLVAAFVLLALG